MIVTADVSGNGAVFTNTGTLEFAAPGTVLGMSGPAQPSGGVGALVFSACGLVRNGAGGAIKVGAGAVTTTISAALENGGVMTVTSPLVLDKAGGALTNAGSLALAGGNVDVFGDYAQSGPGALNVAIGGTTPRTQYYVLSVSGTASLTGALNLSLINGFAPANGNTFTFLNAGTRSGAFSAVTGTSAPGGKLLAATYGATFARIVTLGQSLFLPMIRR
ncbi:MAG: hypothetical protein HZB53_18115 [Chloroflexi bacterium]|nr:hypothetical protein [Chloroflexota bacterium]